METLLYLLGGILFYSLIGIGYGLLALHISDKFPRAVVYEWLIYPESKSEFLRFVFAWPIMLLFQVLGPPCYAVVLLILNFGKIFDKLLSWNKAYKKLK